MRKTTATAGGGTVLAGGGYSVHESISYWDGFATYLPIYVSGLCVAVAILAIVCISLWRRIKALEGK